MNLQIINNKGTYEISGNLTRPNIEIVQEKFNHLLNHYDEIIMSLDHIEKIDDFGIEILKQLRLKALKRSKILFVLLRSNRQLLSKLKNKKSVYILREDY